MRATLLLLIATPVLAQVNEVVHADPSRGATLLPGSAAYADQATAGAYNPAGISHVSALELFYAHEHSFARGQVVDGVYVGASPFGMVGTALSLEWLRGGGNDHRKFSWQLGVGGEWLSAGVGFNWFSAGTVGGLFSLDLGLQSRPWRAVSLGVTLKNVDAPSQAGITLARKLDIGVGVRPFGERLTVGIDYVFDELRGPGNGQLAYSVTARLFDGFTIHAGASHGFNAAQPLMLQVGLGVDLPNVGVAYAVSGSAAGFNHLVMARASVQPYPGLPVRSHLIVMVSLSKLGEPVSGGTVATLLGLPPEDRYLRTVVALERAAKDPMVDGVLLKVDSSGIGFGRAKELREAVLKLKAAGKQVVAYMLNASDADYFVASAAHHVYAAPEAMLLIDGVQSNVLFFGGSAELLGVTVDVARVGPYKNSPDQFTRKDMSAEQREAVSAYLDTDVREMAEGITASRGLTAEQWSAAVDEGLKPAKRCQELKLIDEILAPAQLEERLGVEVPGAHLAAKYPEEPVHDGRWGRKARVAVIPVVGTISGGNNQQDPFGLTNQAGADSFIRALDAASNDPSVKAIVLRIDSPGGDGLASDLMYRAVLEAKKKKPVVASMGDVAASGGYYAAMGANEIFAEPTTITGSIGVFFLKPSLKTLAEKLGVHQESVTRGELAGITDFYEPWSDKQRAAAQKWVDAFYDNFITEAASSRNKKKEDIDAVAKGRVWSGADAIKHGLVDRMGGFAEALASAKARAGASDDVDVVVYGPNPGLLASLVQGSVFEAPVREAGGQAPVSPLTQLARELGAEELTLTGGLKAHLGYGLTIK